MKKLALNRIHLVGLIGVILLILGLSQGNSSADELLQDRQETQVVLPDIGITLDPIPATYDPSIEAQEAADIATAENLPMDPIDTNGEMFTTASTPGPVPPAADSATLVLFTDSEFMVGGDFENESEVGASLVYEEIPVWVITYSDVCVPDMSPQGAGECASTTLHVAVDSETGEYLEAYSYE